MSNSSEDLTGVIALTFVVSRADVLEMLTKKVEFLRRSASLWEQASTDMPYMQKATAADRKSALENARKEGVPPEMVMSLALENMQRGMKKNANMMAMGASQWEAQRKHLAPRESFTLTQEQLNQLGAEDPYKLFPPDWETIGKPS